MSYREGKRRTSWIMKKRAVDHRKAHKSPYWRIGARWPRANVPAAEVPPRGRPDDRGRGLRRARETPAAVPGSLLADGALNWSLRRYVRASSLRVWLRRQAPREGAASVSAGRSGLFRAASPRAGTAARAGSPGPVARADGVSRLPRRALRYRKHRNRQMELLTQVAASLRGGVRRDTAITPRESTGAEDLGMATLSNRVCVESNIFGFVMT
jgi:hypothetical protein